jgi:MoaA/NifB/PqqE/SkfB family radical SAM enzyme
MAINDKHEFFIQWHITERCNLHCSHCYQQEAKASELSLPEIKEVIDEAADMVWDWEEAYDIKLSMSYNVSGGEPFLRADIFEMLEEMAWKGADIYILSNGTLIDSEIAGKLAGLKVKGVQVSVEGPEPVHDGIRGMGSFASAVNGITNLIEAGLTVTMNSTLSTVNAKYFFDLVDLARSLNVQRLGFSRLVPYGRGAAMLDKMIAADEVRDLYNKIYSLDTGKLKIVTGDPVASQSILDFDGKDMGKTASGGCAAGVSGLTILSDGTITPCRRLDVPIGNVKRDSLRELWAASPLLDALRDRSRYEGKCGTCSRWAGCRGCRAVAYAYSKARGKDNYLAEDPQCFLNAIAPELP